MNIIDPAKLSDTLGYRSTKRKIAAFQFANKKVYLYEVWVLEYENSIATTTVSWFTLLYTKGKNLNYLIATLILFLIIRF